MSEPGVVRRARVSILFKVVAALVLALVASTAITAVVTARLTGSALAAQARRVAVGHLSVVAEAYAERERTLVVSLRNLAENLKAAGLTGPGREADLIAEIGRAASNLELELLRVFDAEGREVVPDGGVGDELAPDAAVPARGADVEPASRLIRTTSGKFVQAVPVRVEAGANSLVVVGGYEFSDAFAYRLRRQIGSVDNVVLVAGGQMAGSTLPVPPSRPPSTGDRGTLPRSPAVVRIDGVASLVAYVPLGRAADDPTAGALGVVLANPVASLHRSLARTRLVTSVLLTLVALGLGGIAFRALIRPLVELAGTAGLIAAGNTTASFSARGSDEISVLAGSLEHMRRELAAKLDLIAQQAAALQESSRRIVAATDGERNRLARDLHDGLQQQLVVLRMQVGMLQDSPPEAGAATSQAFDTLGQQLDGVIEQLREVTHDLYPSILLDRGLAAALRSYIGRLPVSCRLTTEPEELPRLAHEIESGAYFLIGEAVTNALKHSGGTALDVLLRLDGEQLEVTVRDDGRGFDPESIRRRGGLLHMDDRVRSFGGSLVITSEPAQGTVVVATFPARAPIDASL